MYIGEAAAVDDWDPAAVNWKKVREVEIKYNYRTGEASKRIYYQIHNGKH